MLSATEMFRPDKEGCLERPLDAAAREQRAVLGIRFRARCLAPVLDSLGRRSRSDRLRPKASFVNNAG
jgi:hypothetical protein